MRAQPLLSGWIGCLVLSCLQLAAAQERKTFDFEMAAIDKLPNAWLEARTGEGSGSVWRVVVDPTAPAGSHVLAQTSDQGPDPSFNVCVHANRKWRDLDLRVAFKPVRGMFDQGGGLVWRFRDANNYYVARFNPLEDNFRVYKVIAGVRTQLASADAVARAGHWHTLRITHRGSAIECYLDDQRLLTADDKSISDSGLIGLWTKADAITYFDQLTIEDLGK